MMIVDMKLLLFSALSADSPKDRSIGTQQDYYGSSGLGMQPAGIAPIISYQPSSVRRSDIWRAAGRAGLASTLISGRVGVTA